MAAALGYKDTKKAIKAHVADEDKTLIQRGQNTPIENHLPKSVFPFNFVDANIPTRGMTIINESGLYSLILSSKLESAKTFKHWVTAEVLPTIRKTGGYINHGQEDLFVDTYLPFLDENYRNLFKLNLQVIDQLNGKLRKNALYVNIDIDMMSTLQQIIKVVVGSEKAVTGIADVVAPATPARTSGVYTLSGIRVADSLSAKLPKGVYVVNGKKVIK